MSVDTWGHPQREQISTGCPTSGGTGHRGYFRISKCEPNVQKVEIADTIFSRIPVPVPVRFAESRTTGSVTRVFRSGSLDLSRSRHGSRAGSRASICSLRRPVVACVSVAALGCTARSHASERNSAASILRSTALRCATIRSWIYVRNVSCPARSALAPPLAGTPPVHRA